MADGRFVTKRISSNEQLGRVSWQADLFFTKCISHLDVEGRLTGNPVLLKSQVVPLRAEITVETIPGLIEELAAAVGHEGEPLVLSYEVNGQQVLAFPGFRRVQRGLRADREAPSRFPPPPPPPEARRRKSGATPELVRSRSGPTPAQVQVEVQGEVQVQGEGKESPAGDGADASGAAARGGWPARFERIWRTHIGKAAHGEIAAALRDLVETHGEEAIERALAAWAKQAPQTEKPQFLNPRAFARQASVWVERTKPVATYDERTGEPTPEFLMAVGRGR